MAEHRVNEPKFGGSVSTQMRQSPIRRYIIEVCLLAFSASACSNVRLQQQEKAQYAPAQVTAEFCSTDASTVKGNLKFIFIIDRSGSNNLPPDVSDPSGDRRFPPLIDFVTKTSGDTSTYFSMINLGTGARMVRDFTNDSPAFLSLLNREYQTTASTDTQWTDYISALEEARRSLVRDIDAAKAQAELVATTYVLFFISDGFPMMNNAPQVESDILNKILQLMVLRDQNKEVVDTIQINTAFYYSSTPPLSDQQIAAEDLLRRMAVQGRGEMLSFGAGQVIDFRRFSVPEKILKFSNKEIWVENINTIWEDRYLRRDADGDGISDLKEGTLGSGPGNWDSDGNGVGDGVELRVSGRPCKDILCQGGGLANPYTSCQGLTPKNPFGDRDKDGLNDCEELLLGSNETSADTNDDFVPDLFAFRRGLPMNGVSNDLISDPDKDSLTNYVELLRNTPLLMDNSLVPGLRFMSYSKKLILDTPTQSCYSVVVNDLATFTPQDRIRFYAIDTTDVIAQRRTLRMATKPIGYGSVHIAPEDFQ